jgi:beta-glucanase (GH16 family)
MKFELAFLAVFTLAASLFAAPVQVTVIQEVPVDIMMDGKSMGATKLQAGQSLELVSKDSDFAILSMGGKSTVKVPVAACQFPLASVTPVMAAPVTSSPEVKTGTNAAAAIPASGPPQSQFALNPGASSSAGEAKDTEKVNPNWKLVWSDEFEGDSIDMAKWQFEVNGDGGGNNELQYYTDRKKNAQIRDGKLVITAIKEDYTGADGKKKPYTSARLKTKGKGDWKYGRMEARIKLVKGKGMWPAFWMMPTDAVYGGWARSGEIDIMELVGHEANTVYGTLHYGDGWPKNVHTGDKTVLKSGDFDDDFHVFAVEWEEGVIRWYLDGVRYQTQTKWNSVSGPYPAPFDQKFFIILNLAVGGAWPGKPADSTRFPQSMEVDYVRVYQP